MDGDSIVYELKHPITLTLTPRGGEARTETKDEVTVRPPRAKDIRMLDKIPGKIAQSLALIGALTGLSSAEVDELSGADVTTLGGIIGGFFQDGPATGEMYSET